MKILYVTTISITMNFFVEHFKMLTDEGHEVELACNCEEKIPEFCIDLGLKIHHVPFSRSPASKSNISALKQLQLLIKNGNYDVVHTHTPNASACVRFACRKLRKKDLKVFYTAHGFHFYKGAPLLNWLLYYPVEWLCAHWTDTLITINHEDYSFAKKHMHAKKVLYVPGVGIDLNKLKSASVDRVNKRYELGVPNDAKLLLSVGELNENKNHETVIKAIKDTNTYYIIAGIGDKKEYLQSIIDNLGMTDRVKLIGYRSDIAELCAVSDVFVFPSFREGLSVALMEAMAGAKPCVVSRIRGNTDLIDENGGELFNPHNIDEAKKAIEKVISADLLSPGEYNKNKVKDFSLDAVIAQMKEIYTNRS